MRTALAVMLVVLATMAVAETIPSLATVLSPDGRIMEAVSGSFNPSGFHMTYGSDGEPIFVEEGSSLWEVVPFHEGQDDEGTWYALGSGVNGMVFAIDVSDTGVLYAGGFFTQAGGISANRIACWDGTSWHALGSGVNNTVHAIATSGSDVFVGGQFTEAGGNPAASRIASWDGSSWHALGGSLNNPVAAIAVSGSDVYVGGYFFQAGGSPANYIACWDGSSWHALGSSVNSYVTAIAVSGSDVYVGGKFTQAGGNPANYISRWDGTSWHTLGSGVGGGSLTSVSTLAISCSDVFAGGDFTQAGGNPANNIACWVPEPTGTEPPMAEVFPSGRSLLQASPNPLTDGTNLSFQSISASPLTLFIYDTTGRLVRTQDLGTLPDGSHSHYWDGNDGNGSSLASGVYFVRLSSTEQQASTRVVLIR